jgi:hypothetical protein
MTRVWLRVISILEIAGGIFGIAFLAWAILTNPINIFTLIMIIATSGIYILSFVAGVALWRGRVFGRIVSIIVQAIQLPKIISPVIIFMFSFGFDAWVHFLLSSGSMNMGFDIRFLAFNQFFLNIQTAPIGIGVSVTSCVFLPILVRYKPQHRVEETLPPPPIEWGDSGRTSQVIARMAVDDRGDR